MGDFFTGVRDFPLAPEVLPMTFIPLLDGHFDRNPRD